MASISLKTQNLVPLSVLTFLQLLVVYFFSAAEFDLSYLDDLATTGGKMIAITVLVNLASFLVPADVKSSLVFLKLKYALPGHRFIQLAESDPRINREVLKSRIPDYGAMTNDYKSQNSFWYREFYRPIVDEKEISTTHKAYLLYRDAAVISLLCCVVFNVTKAMFANPLSAFPYVSGWVFAVAALGFLVAANNAGKRLVTTSIAISLTYA